MTFATLTLAALLISAPPAPPAPPSPPAAPTEAPTTQPAAELPRLAASDAAALRAHMGKPAIVSGTITSAQVSPTGRVLRVVFNDTRQSRFNAPIFERNFKLFRDRFGDDLNAALSGKTVELTGIIEEYRGDPQIILANPEQIKILP